MVDVVATADVSRRATTSLNFAGLTAAGPAALATFVIFWYSWVFAALSLVSVPLYPLGYFSLAELEVVVFGLGALWALLMLASLRDGGL